MHSAQFWKKVFSVWLLKDATQITKNVGLFFVLVYFLKTFYCSIIFVKLPDFEGTNPWFSVLGLKGLISGSGNIKWLTTYNNNEVYCIVYKDYSDNVMHCLILGTQTRLGERGWICVDTFPKDIMLVHLPQNPTS